MQCGSPLSDATKQTKKPKLILLNDSKVEKEFTIESKSIIGKGGDISVDGANFKDNLAELKLDGDRLVLTAMSNDVFMQIAANKPLELANGTILKIGDKVFKVDLQ